MVDKSPKTQPGAKETALHAWHVKARARMTVFAGWSMPLYYSSILTEHMQVRRRAGLFDVSHMGRFLLLGDGAEETLSRLIPGAIVELGPGQAKYTVMLNRQGGIRDDFIIYKRAHEDFLLVVNAGNASKDSSWIEEHLVGHARLEDKSSSTCLIALQGPASQQVLDKTGARGSDGSSLAALKYFHFAEGAVAGVPATVMRTGYTGEDGFELMIDCDHAERVWDALLAADVDGLVLPCGLGARDSLRLEAGLLLHGTDMDETTNPYETGLGWLVNLDKGDFIGREALEAARATGPSRLLAGLASRQRAILRTGDEIQSSERAVGRITSGTYSPVLGYPVALGYVLPEFASPGTELQVVVRGRPIRAEIVKKPFYRAGVTPLPPENRKAVEP